MKLLIVLDAMPTMTSKIGAWAYPATKNAATSSFDTRPRLSTITPANVRSASSLGSLKSVVVALRGYEVAGFRP